MLTAFEGRLQVSGVLYGASGGIWVMVLFRKPEAGDMLRARESLTAMKARHPRGFPTLTWVLPSAGISMDGDARRAAAEVTAAFSKEIRAMATLIEGSGFRGAAVRAIVASLDFMSRASAPKQVFADLGESVHWCLGHVPGVAGAAAEVTAREITSAIAAARATLPAAG
jgi:hypothetical protein